MRVVEPLFLLEHSVYGLSFARVFTETLGVSSMCQIIYRNTLYVDGVLPEYLLKHSVRAVLNQMVYWNTLCIEGVLLEYLLKHSVWAVLSQMVYWIVLYIDSVLPEYLLKHSV